MQEIAKEKLMTTKEVAKAMGVDVRTIQRTVERLDLKVERFGRCHTMMFDEKRNNYFIRILKEQ